MKKSYNQEADYYRFSVLFLFFILNDRFRIMIDIKFINSAFSPAQEILDPELFVGRKEQIRNGMLCLNNPGSFMSIYGLRGVGKSSIAHQIELIAQGEQTLPNILNLIKFIPKGGFKYLTH